MIHFDIPAADPERAIRFCTEVFAWKFDKWQGPMDYWLITTGPDGEEGIDGGMGRSRHPGECPINIIGVLSVDEYVEKIIAAGGEILQPWMAIPGVGWYASCRDTEGNIFGLMENDPLVK